jgi:hypothetical protein
LTCETDNSGAWLHEIQTAGSLSMRATRGKPMAHLRDSLMRSCEVAKLRRILVFLQPALLTSALLGGNTAWGQVGCTQGDVTCRVTAAGAVERPLPAGRAAALEDLAGQWVSVVSEDWRFRMVTPPKGDYESLPLNGEGRKVADTWSPEADRSKDACMAYGAAAIMRNPSRFRISWQGDDVLLIETDAGQQTRRLLFSESTPVPEQPTRQGFSRARWLEEGQPQGKTKYGTLKVVTTQLLPGYLRKNGVPVSAGAVVTEYFDRSTTQNGDEWLVVSTVVEDPQYLARPFATSTHLKRERDPAGWHPEPCLPGNPLRAMGRGEAK